MVADESTESPTPGLEPMLLLASVIAVVVGGPLLEMLGIAYVSRGGILLEKLHPSTYVILAAFGCFLVARGDPVAFVQRRWVSQGSELFFLGTLAVVATLGVALHGTSGLAYLVDAFVAPVLFALMLPHVSPRARGRIFKAVLWLLTLNAAIALVEYAGRRPLIGFLQWAGDEFRSSALLGHPLNNALITVPAAILGFHLATTVRGGPVLPPVLLSLALLAFGGRAATMVALLGVGALVVLDLALGLARRTLTLGRVVLYLALMLGGPVAVLAVLGGTSLGQRILERFYLDPGAQTRLDVLDIFNYIGTDQLWFGIDSNKIAAVLEFEAPTSIMVVENFWIFMIINLGIVSFTILAAGFIPFLIKLARSGDHAPAVTVLTFIVTASSNNSLASKTTALTILVALVFGLGDFVRSTTRQPQT